MKQKAVGIKDVAREAGVSVTTVSHVLNNVEHTRTSEETRRRIENTAARLGYRPNRIARSLRTQRTEMIGILSEDIATTPHAGRILVGVQDAARAAGLTVVLVNSSQDASQVESDLGALLRQQVDGILYATMYHREIRVPTRLKDVATVLIDAEDVSGQKSGVVPDERQGARLAVDELIAHGHRRIGFITNTDDVPATRLRLLGYKDALQSARIPFDPNLVEAQPSETSGGYEAARRLLQREERPTAIFCYNDRMAMGAYRAAAERGIRIPTDLSVVGFDNQEYVADGLYPALTTVALPHYEMGRWAMERLVKLLTSDSQDDTKADVPTTEVLACPLVRRDSVARPSR